MSKYEIDPYTAAIRAWRKEKYGEEESRAMDRVDIFKNNGHSWVLDEEATLQRMRALEQLCHDLYRTHEGYIGNELHNRLVELGFAEGEQND